ncbi:MAG TPA: RsiV family protein [Candidatus Sulfomarinibacteraceae bacterium]|nr:RsiV family protein [Candidatus Sulfomarinibacteraceae bacterium]
MSRKRPLVLFALAAITVSASCAGPEAPEPPEAPAASDEASVRFETREVSAASSGCDTPGEACARVSVVLADAVGGGSQEVRENLDIYSRHWVVSRLREHLPDGVGDQTGAIEDLAAAFLAQHHAFTAEFPDAAADWFIEVEAEPLFSSAEVATLDLSIAAYTGGAHPNAQRQLVSFAVPSGQLLGADDLTTDVEALTAAVERRFREQRGLGHDDDFEAAGFWLSDGRFTLPDNLGLTADGLLVHWNAYEIAPYAMGPTTVLVPASDLTDILTLDVR